jgi:hypothetical protein
MSLEACRKSTPAQSFPSQGNHQVAPDPTNLLALIRFGMTFAEVGRIIPLTTNLRGFNGEAGGIWYDVTISSNTYLQLRFEHPRGPKNPSGKPSIIDCTLNYPPRLKERNSGRLIGTEDPNAGVPELDKMR